MVHRVFGACERNHWPAGSDDGVLERDAAMQDFFKEIFA
jgi:hypothetical protein